MDDQAGEQERRYRLQVGAVRRHPLVADVPQALPHLPGDAAALETLHGRVVAKHRGLESHQLQHQVRPQDPDDHLPGHGAAGLHGLPVDYRLVDTTTVRKVRARSSDLVLCTKEKSRTSLLHAFDL